MNTKLRPLLFGSLTGVFSPEMIALHDAMNAMVKLYVVPGPKSEKPWFPVPLPWPTIEAVVRAIRHVPEVLAITRLHQRSLGSGKGTPINEKMLASSLVHRAHDLGSAAKAVEELLSLAQINRAMGRLTLVLAGLHVESAIEVAPGVMLLPFSDVQPPPWDKNVEDKRRWPMSKTLEPVGPSAALVTNLKYGPVFNTLDGGKDHYPEPEVERLRTIAKCIALASNGPVATLLLWCEDNDPRLPLPWSGVTIHEWITAGMAMQCDADIQRIRSVITDYQKFNGRKEPIEMSIARLASAWGSRNRESRAIDVGIALEAILMTDAGAKGKESTEISYKLSTRAAWLLGKDFVAREGVFGSVRRLYKLRSEAAHRGRVRVTPDTWQAVDKEIEDGIALTGRLIMTLLSRGSWPNWNKMVLGGSSSAT